jgi:NADPH-dependent ferric siderophore reductase
MSSLKAHATITFSDLTRYLDKIVTLLGDHDMQVRFADGIHVATSPYGTVRVRPAGQMLHIAVEAENGASLNRLKNALTGLVDFVARAEDPAITWTGDKAGDTWPPDFRVLTVRAVRELTPRMRRIRFAGENLAHYDVPDQIHCRLLFQPHGEQNPEWPRLGDNGRLVWPKGGQQLASRIYTMRTVDAATGMLEVDFYLHDAGGAGVEWARKAAPGALVGLLGPGAHGPKPAGWNVYVGDETGLPGMARMIEALPRDAKGIALIEVAEQAEEQPIAAPGGVHIRWFHRHGRPPGTPDPLVQAVRSLDWPADKEGTFFWCGCEYSTFREIRQFLRETVELPNHRQVAFSHWRRGLSNDEIIAAGGDVVAG